MKHFFLEHLEEIKKKWTPLPPGATNDWQEIRHLILDLVEDLQTTRSTQQTLWKDVERLTVGFDTKPFLTKGQVEDLLQMLRPYEAEALKKYGNTIWALVKYVSRELAIERELPQFEDTQLDWKDVMALVEGKRIQTAYSLARNLVHRRLGLDTPERKAAMEKLGRQIIKGD